MEDFETDNVFILDKVANDFRCLSKFPQINLLYCLDSCSRELGVQTEQASTTQKLPQISAISLDDLHILSNASCSMELLLT